jgi:hypothetical protein
MRPLCDRLGVGDCAGEPEMGEWNRTLGALENSELKRGEPIHEGRSRSMPVRFRSRLPIQLGRSRSLPNLERRSSSEAPPPIKGEVPREPPLASCT